MIDTVAGAGGTPNAVSRGRAAPHSPEVPLLTLIKRTVLAAGLIGTTLGAAAQPPRAYPLKDFFRNPERGYFRLADDGKTLGFMQPVSIDGQPPRMNIYVQALADGVPAGEPRKLTSETARDISNFFWKGDDTVLYQKDFGGDENFHVLAVNARTGQVADLTPYEGCAPRSRTTCPTTPTTC